MERILKEPAGAVVTKDVPAYVIAGGTEVIEYRFEEKFITELYEKLNDVRQLMWLPRKKK